MLQGLSAITGTTEVFAIVVYHSGSDFYLESYEWTGTSFVYDASTSINGTFGTTVNIDSDQATGQFIFVFDEGGTNDLFAVTGDFSNGTFAMYNLAVPVNIGTIGNGLSPDVCIYDMVSKIVTYTYVDNIGNLIVDQDDFNALIGGGNAAINVGTFGPQFSYHYNPRIACPNPNSVGVTSDDWTVVVLDSDNSSQYFIVGYNFDNNTGPGTNGPWFYNDGTLNTGTYDLTFENNYGPVVAYTYESSSQPTIMVGWNLDYINPVFSGYPFFYNVIMPLAIQCDEQASPVTGDYWEVPITFNNGETMDFLSLSGRNTNNSLHCTFYYMDQSEVLSKTVGSVNSASNLRILGTSTPSKNEVLKGDVYEITGRKLFSYSGTISDLKDRIDKTLETYVHSIYLVNIYSVNGTFQTNYKIYK